MAVHCEVSLHTPVLQMRLAVSVPQPKQCVSVSSVHGGDSTVLPRAQCSGTYELSVSPKAVTERMQTIEGVANYYGFDWLLEEIGSLVPRAEEAEDQPMMEAEAVAAE
jgi:hypothetical protein